MKYTSEIIGSTTRYRFVALVLFILAGSFVIGLWFLDQKITNTSSLLAGRFVQSNDPCKSRIDWIVCYSDTIGEITVRNGPPAAIAYALDVVREHPNDSAFLHMSLHMAGHEAYHLVEDVDKAFSYLPDKARTKEDYFLYDGYQHGIFEALFLHLSNISAMQLMRRACSDHFNPESQSAPIDSYIGIASDQCFHGMGHALMPYYENDVFAALLGCDELPYSRMRQNCYNGVFMENVYLHGPVYSFDKLKPNVSGNLMTPLCNQVKENQRARCASHVGWAFFATDWGNFKGAMDACSSVEEKYQKNCIAHLSGRLIPTFVEGDFSEMLAVCKYANLNEDACIDGLAVRIRQDYGEDYDEEKPVASSLCALAGERFKDDCLNAVKTNFYVYDVHLPSF